MTDLHIKARDYFTIAMNEYEGSRDEASEIRDFNHNKHYTIAQLNVLRNRKQPEETFNIIKSYKRVLSGYLSSTINNINVKATTPDNTDKATLGNDIVQYVLRDNDFKMMRADLQDDLILSGLVGFEITPVDSGTKDRFGTPKVDLQLKVLHENELAIDPLFKRYDYGDARFIHTFKWVPNEYVKEMWPNKVQELEKYIDTANFNNFNYTTSFSGMYNTYYNSLIVKTQMKVGKKIWQLLWSGDILLETTDITHYGSFSIKPFTMEKTEDAEYYGLFREVLESQKAINQALIQIQLLVNTNKVLVTQTALVDNDLEAFRLQYNQLNAIIPVKDLNGVKVENMSGDVVAQYNIISAALSRIKQVLNLNDSFLGMAGSSASGRQVKLQQNMTASALQYLTSKLDFIYTELAKSILEMAKLYYKANTLIRISDEVKGDSYIAINDPVTINGEIQYKDNIQFDDKGVAKLEPWFYKESTLDELDYEVELTTSNYNETDDMESLQLDNIIQGPAGQMLMQTDPGKYAEVVALKAKVMKTRNSEAIADIFNQVAKKLEGVPTQDPRQVPPITPGVQGQQGGTSAAGMMSAAGMTNDAQPAGYNQPKG